MRLSWQGWGRRVYPLIDGCIVMEWRERDGLMLYTVYSIRSNTRRLIFERIVP